MELTFGRLGRVAQSATCLTADPGVASSIPAQSRTFREIDHDIISTAILLPSADSRRVVVSYKRYNAVLSLIYYVVCAKCHIVFTLCRLVIVQGSICIQNVSPLKFRQIKQ